MTSEKSEVILIFFSQLSYLSSQIENLIEWRDSSIDILLTMEIGFIPFKELGHFPLDRSGLKAPEVTLTLVCFAILIFLGGVTYTRTVGGIYKIHCRKETAAQQILATSSSIKPLLYSKS
jgi:hypothetical protein